MDSIHPGHQKLIEELLLKKFRNAVKNNEKGAGTPIWKNLFFILDLLGQGDFYGQLEWVILGTSTKDIIITRRTFKVDMMYTSIVSSSDKGDREPQNIVIRKPGD